MEDQSGNRFAVIIPARYASTRFPGKPLVKIGSKTMIQRVYEQASMAAELVYVATDDGRIMKAVNSFGGKAVMTSADHFSGTDRCAEAAAIITAETGRNIDIVLNIQGDEPFINPEQIELLKSCFTDSSVQIATLVRKTEPGEDIFNPNHVKVVVDFSGNAIYFSRAAIPYLRGTDASRWSHEHVYYKHLGLYAYTTEVLRQITAMKRSMLESAESLEQNRWIENGIKIRTAVTGHESISIDTPEDLERALRHLDENV
ncbi:MAG: 3-deoxy-manno-octulosonate cytidylyltransferase [Bacteroidales bacterium]|jgi:3-deoxy-manno-octulosonate cytidylyltransferase (CMP-KDO synthetase)|nr:3-deoxy-manno-octulosonate cytidylyltransferase [Bacteroidales bacterium]